MSWSDWLSVVTLALVLGMLAGPPLLLGWWWWRDRRQSQHAVLRNFPLLGRLRYLLEHVGPELRQYLFEGDRTGKPFSRDDFLGTVFASKYMKTLVSFGSKRDFEQPGWYLRNALLPTLAADLLVDSTPRIETRRYVVDHDGLFSRRESLETVRVAPWTLLDECAPVLGAELPHPWVLRGLVGMSGMSYGALGRYAIEAAFHQQAALPQVVGFELKLHQGAKIRGGHVEGHKVTPEIAAIRRVPAWTTIDSPNRLPFVRSIDDLLDHVARMRAEAGKPVATYREMDDTVGLPVRSAILEADDALRRAGVRDRVGLIASGKLFSPDRVALALCFGADAVAVARGMMISAGCIQAQKCHTDSCPVGVATTDERLMRALVVEEKQYRVLNYVTTLRAGLASLTAAAGLRSPTEFRREHAVYRSEHLPPRSAAELFPEVSPPRGTRAIDPGARPAA